MSDKQIHIEKYDCAAFEVEKKPFTMVLTDLIQKFPINRSSELLLWMFLESLPTTWVPNKKHIMAHFGISDRTYERYMSYLNATNLIEYRQNRKASGSFGEWTLIVLNGTRFNPEAVSNRSAKIDGTVINRVKNEKVIHNLDDHRSAKFGGTAEPLRIRSSSSDSNVSPFRQITVERCGDVHINKTIKEIKEKKKTNNPISVFSESCFVKTHIETVVAQRHVILDEEIIKQGVFYCFDTNEDKSFDSVNKRVNIFLKLVKEKKWLIPQGYERPKTKPNIDYSKETVTERGDRQFMEREHEKERTENYISPYLTREREMEISNPSYKSKYL